LALRVTAHRRVTGQIVLAEFHRAVLDHGVPASTLTDNEMVFTTRFSGGKGTGSSPSCVASGSPKRTPGRTTRRPVARSNGSSRR
jgi:hypothetical protein